MRNDEICLRCAHANFAQFEGTTFQGFAKCEKSASILERAQMQNSKSVCEKGKFEPAPDKVVAKREVKLTEWRQLGFTKTHEN